MTEESHKLKENFEAFREECIDLAILINTFDALFIEPREVDSYANVSPQFFGDLNRWLIDLYYLRVFRVLDKGKTFGHDNLTANFLVERLNAEGDSTDEIDLLLMRLNCYKNLVQQARHRVVAHADLETMISGETVGSHDESCSRLFRKDLQDFCDAVARRVGSDPSQFIDMAPGDVQDLIKTLSKCTKEAKESDDR